MKKDLLYTDLAGFYDTIYADKDYKKECEWLIKLIAENKTSPGNKLLDIACGTGNHILYLKDKFICEGMDKNLAMLNIAKGKLPGITFYNQDMRQYITDTYDIIICMFSSIAYLESYKNFTKVINNINNALEPGGIVIIQPWFEVDKFTPGIAYTKIYDNMIRVSMAHIDGICSIAEYHYLITRDNKIKYIVDNHKMALFDIARLIEIMNDKEIESKFIPPHNDNGRGLIIGVKKQEQQ